MVEVSGVSGWFNSKPEVDSSSTNRRRNVSELIQLEDLQPEALGEVIRARAGEFDKATLRAVEHAWHAGRALLAAKKLIPHGQWGQWLSDNFEGRSQQTASNWMRLAANYQSAGNLESVKHGLLMLEESPEKQAKKAEREARKAEAPPKSLAPATPAPPVSAGTIRHENPPSQPQRPAWLADPDELDRPEEDDLSPLPRTNTHHTSANRRTPDARETDRVGIVPPDDPRSYHDGHWYEWNEDRGRMVAVTEDQILWRGKAIGEARGLVLTVSDTVTQSWGTASVVEHAGTTTPVVEHKRDSVSSKRFTPPTADEVSAYSDEINAGVDGQQFVDFYESKGWMIGKNKMKDWRAAVRTWKRSESQRGPKISTAVRSNRNWDEEIPEWKPTE